MHCKHRTEGKTQRKIASRQQSLFDWERNWMLRPTVPIMPCSSCSCMHRALLQRGLPWRYHWPGLQQLIHRRRRRDYRGSRGRGGLAAGLRLGGGRLCRPVSHQTEKRTCSGGVESPTLIRGWDLIGALSSPSASPASHWLPGIPLASYESVGWGVRRLSD